MYSRCSLAMSTNPPSRYLRYVQYSTAFLEALGRLSSHVYSRGSPKREHLLCFHAGFGGSGSPFWVSCSVPQFDWLSAVRLVFGNLIHQTLDRPLFTVFSLVHCCMSSEEPDEVAADESATHTPVSKPKARPWRKKLSNLLL